MILTKEQALRAITARCVTIEDVLSVMPEQKDPSHPHAEDADILKSARDEGSSLSDVLRNASEIGGSGFEEDLIAWIGECLDTKREVQAGSMTDVFEQALLATLKAHEDAAATVSNEDYQLFRFFLQNLPWSGYSYTPEDTEEIGIALIKVQAGGRAHKNLHSEIKKLQANPPPENKYLGPVTDNVRAHEIEVLKIMLEEWREHKSSLTSVVVPFGPRPSSTS
jgi:hypothetical protein